MAQLQFTLSQEQYEALIAYAREGTKNDAGQVDQDKALRLDSFLRSIERENGVTRDGVWVRWLELGAPSPAEDFPDEFPPKQSVYIEYVTRKVTRADVDEMLRQQAIKPITIMITRDPGAICGWTELDKFFR